MSGCSCGNLNFARRVECNKCGAPSPAGSDDRGGRGGSGYNRGGSGGGYGNSRGGRGDNYDDRNAGGGRTGSYGGSQGRDGGGYAQGPPHAPPSYGAADSNYPPPSNTYGRNPDAVPPPTSYVGGPASYPPSYGAPGGYGGDTPANARGGGRGGPPGGYDGGYGGGQRNAGGYDSSPAEAPEKVKQCDENCGDFCDNARIYISNLPPDVTIEELRELFGSIGQVICRFLSVMILSIRFISYCSIYLVFLVLHNSHDFLLCSLW